jgi:hypothetical protein
MGVRAKEDGKSEGRSVMGRIGVAPPGKITPRESGQTSIWSFLTRKTELPTQETKQMAAVETQAGAVPNGRIDWTTINWRTVNQNVRRLQSRIVKATQEGRWNKVRALQRLLTHSFSARCLAVKRVTTNQGKKTPGVDGAIWDTPDKKATAANELKARGYRPQPLKRVYIPKSDGRQRGLSIPIVHSYCTSIQSVWGFQINTVERIGKSVVTVHSLFSSKYFTHSRKLAVSLGFSQYPGMRRILNSTKFCAAIEW